MALFRTREIVWQRRLLAELGEEQQGPTPLYCDSQGAIALAKNPVLHGLTKHMRVKWHWTRSMVAAGEVELHYVKTTGQPADMMTKRLFRDPSWLGTVWHCSTSLDARGAASGGAAFGGANPGGAESEGAGSGGAEPGGEEPGGAEHAGVELGGAEPEGVEPGGSKSEAAESRGAEPRGAASSGGPAGASPQLSPQQLHEWLVRRARLWIGATGAGGTGDARVRGAGVTAGGTGGSAAPGLGGARTRGAGAAGTGGAGGTVSRNRTLFPCFSRFLVSRLCLALLLPFCVLRLTSRYRRYCQPPHCLLLLRYCEPVRTARRVPRARPPPVPGTHAMALRPSSVPLRVPLPAPPESSLPEVRDPKSDRARAASSTVSRLLTTAVTDPSFCCSLEST
ncbi:unnamed protein product [Closterium sp. NIES-53]